MLAYIALLIGARVEASHLSLESGDKLCESSVCDAIRIFHTVALNTVQYVRKSQLTSLYIRKTLSTIEAQHRGVNNTNEQFLNRL